MLTEYGLTWRRCCHVVFAGSSKCMDHSSRTICTCQCCKYRRAISKADADVLAPYSSAIWNCCGQGDVECCWCCCYSRLSWRDGQACWQALHNITNLAPQMPAMHYLSQMGQGQDVPVC